MSVITEYEDEPVPGLPGFLPQGERIVWQGSPDWKSFAMSIFHLRWVALYFAALALWGAFTGAAMGALVTVGVGIAGIALMALMSWLMARATLYTLTNERIVFRIGVALPMCINLPVSIIETARMHVRKDGTADIALVLSGKQRAGYLMLWPHARPWKLARPEPMLRAVPEGAKTARLIAQTLAAATTKGRVIPLAEAETAPETLPEGAPA